MKTLHNINKIVFLQILWCLWIAVLPANVLADTPIQKLAHKLVSSLDRQIALQNKEIQLQSGAFVESSSGMGSSFAVSLVEALAAELSKKGVVISVHARGDEPLSLHGSYRRNVDDLTVTLQLTQMALAGSREIAVVQENADFGKVEDAATDSSLDDLAAALVADLEKTAPIYEGGQVVVALPLPTSDGAPTLYLGRELQKSLERAVNRSATFGAVAVVSNNNPHKIFLTARYEVGDDVRYHAELQAEDGRQLSTTRGQLPRDALAPRWFFPLVEYTGEICVGYDPAAVAGAVPASSPTAFQVVRDLQSLLARTGVNANRCENLSGAKSSSSPIPEKADIGFSSRVSRVMIYASLRLRQKKLRDGYGVLNGELQLTTSDGSVVGSVISAKENVPYAEYSNDARGALVKKLFSDDLAQRTLAAVAAYRPLSPINQ